MILYYFTKLSKIKKKVLLTILFIFILFIAITQIHSFLTLNNPIQAEILVVEGWLDYDYLPIILEEYKRNNYYRIVVVGPDRYDGSEKENDKKIPYVELIAMRLRLISKNSINIVAVKSDYVQKNRTFSYLVGFKKWLIRELPNIKSLNLISPSVHARKSYLLLRRILPLSVNVGVISIPALSYNPKYWWLSKSGLWIVFKNIISYTYAFLFLNCKNLKC